MLGTIWIINGIELNIPTSFWKNLAVITFGMERIQNSSAWEAFNFNIEENRKHIAKRMKMEGLLYGKKVWKRLA